MGGLFNEKYINNIDLNNKRSLQFIKLSKSNKTNNSFYKIIFRIKNNKKSFRKYEIN